MHKIKPTFKKVVIALSVLSMSSCSKEDCEKRNYGSIKLTNSKPDSYYGYIDGNRYFTLAPFSSATQTQVSAGKHEIKLEQANGYLLYPTVYVATADVISCQTKEVTN